MGPVQLFTPQFARSMTGYKSNQSIADFWDHCASHKEWADHPALVSGVARDRDYVLRYVFLFLSHFLVGCCLPRNVFCAPICLNDVHAYVLRCSANQGLIPISVHCDGAEFYSNSEYMVWSIGSCLVENDHVFDTKFVTCCLPHEAMQSNDVFWLCKVFLHFF